METTLTRNDITEQIIEKLMAGDSWLSYSSLSAFKKSPKTFIDYKLGQREETDSMVYGSMVHCLVLEPHDFDNRYFCLEDTEIVNSIGGGNPRATKVYKEWKAEQLAGIGNRVMIDTASYQHAQIVAQNVRHNRASRKILHMCPEHEKPVDWEFKNFKFHGFIDGMGDCVFDLKTCADASPKKFQRDLVQMGYYLQAAMYLYALGGMREYYIIAVDKMAGVSVHKLHPHLIEHGMNEYDHLLTKFNECILADAWDQSHDFWADRFDGIFSAEKPSYLY